MKKSTIAVIIAITLVSIGVIGIMGYNIKRSNNGPTVTKLQPSTEKPAIDHSSIVLAEMGDKKVTWSDAEKGSPLVTQLKLIFGPNLESSELMKGNNYYDAWYQSINFQAEKLIIKTIVEDKAEQMGVVPKDIEEQIDIEENRIVSEECGGDKEVFTKKLLELRNNTEKEFREDIKYRIIINEISKELAKDTVFTEEQKLDYYNKNMDKFYKEAGKVDIDVITYEDKEEAEKIEQAIKSGKSTFEQEKQAIKDSKQEVATKWTAVEEFTTVDLGKPVNDSRYVPVVAKLKDGEVSDIIHDDENKNSYYEIAKIIHQNTSTYNSYTESTDKIQGLMAEECGERLFNDKVKEWEKEYNVKLYDIREAVKTAE